MRTLIVDGANVVGSRPDGWWRDRPGAARRLLCALADARLEADAVVLVLEGMARVQDRDDSEQGVQIVNAPGSGDDAIVEAVVAAAAAFQRTDDASSGSGSGREAGVVVITADRGLRARVEAVGATCHGPSWLLDRIQY